MKAPGTKSLDRAAQVLREVLLDTPGCNRSEMISSVARRAECHPSTAEKAVGEAVSEGYVTKTGRAGQYRYFWDDEPDQIDRAPQIVRRIPANELPRITGPRFQPFEWTCYFLFHTYA